MFSRFSRLERLYVMLGVALLLPALVVIVLQTYQGYRVEAEERRQEAMIAADRLLLLSDARVQSDLAALRLLSRSRYFIERDIDAGARRAQEAVELIPGWRAVILSNRKTGEILFDATSDEILRSGTLGLDLPERTQSGVIGGVVRDGRHCPCAYLHVGIPGDGDLVLSAIVDPLVHLRILRQELPKGAVAAIVDRDGRFLARSLDYEQRVGTPATSFVLSAVAGGGRGVYGGTTYEGMTNYTAYSTSDLTGWSSHVAIDVILLDEPERRANLILLAGALAAIVVAMLLFLMAARDTANRRRQEQQMLELQRSEAVSQFTATIVHDFRNVIAALQSGLNMIRRRTRDDDIKAHVASIERSIGRGTRLANQLLSFSHGDEAALQSIDLGEVLADLEFLIGQAVGRGIGLSMEPPPRPLRARANRDQFELAILNLAVNARDATNGTGRVLIQTRDCGETIEVRVSDDGPGVEPERRRSVFTPFLTTKRQGTGLGLAQVAGMARHAGGHVDVEDAEIGGACFVIILPNAAAVREE